MHTDLILFRCFCGTDSLYKLNGERHLQVVIFVAIVGDGHQQLPQISLPGGDVHHLVFTEKICQQQKLQATELYLVRTLVIV